MKILVTGANGMLGQDLVPVLKNAGHNVLETDIHNLDITDKDQVSKYILTNKPELIIHAAAYTNVDGAETETEKAFLINQTGTENIALISGNLNIPIVYISTDYVFDGQKSSPYLPDDGTKPINVYGYSKLMGEETVKELNSKYFIVRTSWLYGHKGKNFVETMINLARTKPELRVVEDQVGCPTWTVALSEAILNLIHNEKYGIYHVCGSGSTSWYGFATKILEFMNIDIPVIPVTSEEFKTAAKRPKYSIMDNGGLCPDWKESLKKYIELRGE
ncbi:MAG: dTDP-4-dehydrorhamnose reductase [Candidatus Gastranaerophilales bacterium]|nr:dTDP-4-dehydrorhamnose reductase [Candidatus Gastranaerophilales bacterium]